MGNGNRNDANAQSQTVVSLVESDDWKPNASTNPHRVKRNKDKRHDANARSVVCLVLRTKTRRGGRDTKGPCTIQTNGELRHGVCHERGQWEGLRAEAQVQNFTLKGLQHSCRLLSSDDIRPVHAVRPTRRSARPLAYLEQTTSALASGANEWNWCARFPTWIRVLHSPIFSPFSESTTHTPANNALRAKRFAQ